MEQLGVYRIEREIGRGAMGVVYQAWDTMIGRPAAVKVMLPGAFDEVGEAKDRFEREASAARRLSHPGIVSVYELGQHQDTLYMAMELVKGESLGYELTGGPVDQTLALPLLRQLAEALDYAHLKGVIHRDVKPANILINAERKVKVTDFGIARITSHNMTRTGITMGTPAYMAPEQIENSRVDGRADQFSLAVMAYQMLTGRRPFTAGSDLSLLYQIMHTDPRLAHELNPGLPRDLSAVLMVALSKDPKNRYPCCLDFIDQIHAALAPTIRIAVPSRLHTVKVNPHDGQPYVWIPPGTFMMGCSPGDEECGEEDEPREVTIEQGFWIGRTPVTQAAYRKVTGANPSHFRGDHLPVENVSWLDAQAYCEKVGMRLPTEAEWEYAARGGNGSARYGDLDAIAWYVANSGSQTHEVAGKQPNRFGLYDILGNVWEWVADRYNPADEKRVLRGGSWSSDSWVARVSMRHSYAPSYRYNIIGFRCAGELS